MNDDNIIREVENRFNAKYYVTNNAWFRDCVEYYLSEHNDATVAEILEFVIAQWQLSDLREISNEKPCLPGNLAREKSTTLQGRFVLQMEKVCDISESKFKQLEKIRNVSDENVEVTEAEKTQSNWEPKRKRMLYFHLTDGTQDVVAIEYKPIRFLNDNLLPGYKLLIKGPVTCRRGVIMLDETNVEEIGGEVADLLVPNALENILARALNLPENPDPYKDNEEAVAHATENTSLFNDDFDIDIDDIAVIEADERRAEFSLPSSNSRLRNDRPGDSEQFETRQSPQSAQIARTESDLLFEEIDDVIFEEEASFNFGSTVKNRSNSVAAPSFNSSSGRAGRTSDENCAPVKSREIKSASSSDVAAITKKNPPQSKSSLISNTKPDFCPTKKLSGLKIDTGNHNDGNHSNNILPTKPMETTANKRTSSALSPPAVNSPAEKMHCPQTSNVKKTPVNNRKITDWITKNADSSSPSRSTPNNVPDCISDVLATKLTDDSVVHKTIKGKVTKFDNLSKNGRHWQLNATITDSTGSIDTVFSSEILESMLGFSVEEFSIKKKLKKTDPNMEAYLRQGFRSAEKKLSRLDDFMEIELTPNQKPKVIKIRGTSD